MHAIGDGSGLRTEFWDYGPGPDLTFRRPSVNLELGLTSEGLAYLEELRTVFPHRYDAGDRELIALPAQLASFRNAQGAGIEFEIHTRVPAELVATKADQLDVGLFFVTASGERRIVHRERVPARESAIHLNVALPPGVSRVVLEVVNPVSGRVASLRSLASSFVFFSSVSIVLR